MRVYVISLIAVFTAASLGCGTTSGDSGKSAEPTPDPTSEELTRTVDGLVKVEIEGPGHLFLRQGHGIGGYDAIAVAPAFVTYRRTSAKLDPDAEEVYLVSLEQAIVDVADAANVRVVNAPGDCVIKVGGGFVNVDLARSDTAKVLGVMTLVVEYQDSMSGQSLLRYASQQRVMREADGTSRQEQVEQSFDEMIENINIIEALRKATAIPSPPKEGCGGDLASAGQTAAVE
jgi:hypothetical protein